MNGFAISPPPPLTKEELNQLNEKVTSNTSIINANLPLNSKLKLMEYLWGKEQIPVGSRSDGAIHLYRTSDLIVANIKLIAGGQTTYTLDDIIPTQWAPSTTLTQSVCCVASNVVQAVGRIQIQSNGTIFLLLGTTSPTETYVTFVYPAKSFLFN